MVSKTAEKKNIENKTSLVSRKIWEVEQESNPILDIGDVNEMDLRIVNNYPDGHTLTARDNDGSLVDLRITEGKILKANSTYSEV